MLVSAMLVQILSAPRSPAPAPVSPKRRSPPKPSGLFDKRCNAAQLVTKKLNLSTAGAPPPPELALAPAAPALLAPALPPVAEPALPALAPALPTLAPATPALLAPAALGLPPPALAPAALGAPAALAPAALPPDEVDEPQPEATTTAHNAAKAPNRVFG
jgi:hypothetical protein